MPVVMLTAICSYLKPWDLCMCNSVCRMINRVTNATEMWIPFLTTRCSCKQLAAGTLMDPKQQFVDGKFVHTWAMFDTITTYLYFVEKIVDDLGLRSLLSDTMRLASRMSALSVFRKNIMSLSDMVSLWDGSTGYGGRYSAQLVRYLMRAGSQNNCAVQALHLGVISFSDVVRLWRTDGQLVCNIFDTNIVGIPIRPKALKDIQYNRVSIRQLEDLWLRRAEDFFHQYPLTDRGWILV
jgi:hypothetical protein